MDDHSSKICGVYADIWESRLDGRRFPCFATNGACADLSTKKVAKIGHGPRYQILRHGPEYGPDSPGDRGGPLCHMDPYAWTDLFLN